jgi:hypothetical protein
MAGTYNPCESTFGNSPAGGQIHISRMKTPRGIMNYDEVIAQYLEVVARLIDHFLNRAARAKAVV